MGNYRFLFWVCFIFTLFPSLVKAQQCTYVVTFTDKDNSPYRAAQALDFLSQEAIDRRKEPISSEDFPPNPRYLQGLTDSGAKLRYRSKWMNNALVEMDSMTLSIVEALDYVATIVLAAPALKSDNTGGRVTKSRMTDRTTNDNQFNVRQNTSLGIDLMHERGFKGAGLKIAVFDGGFPVVDTAPAFGHLRDTDRIGLTHNFIDDTTDVYRYDKHGTQVFSVLGAYLSEDYVGIAYESDFMLFITEDVSREYRIEEYYWLYAAEMADSAGVDIIQSSLGYNLFDDRSMDYDYDDLDGNTTIITKAAQLAAEKGILVVTSAGNEGNNAWRHITAPSDARDVMAVGAMGRGELIASFSSVGPTVDGRTKPDLVALGTGVATLPVFGTGIRSGTSFAAPLVAGLAAGVWQAYPELDNLELMALLKNSADRSFAPDNTFGHGIPHFQAVVNFREQENIDFKDGFIVYPNPTEGRLLHIRAKSVGEWPQVRFRIIDTLGAEVMSGTYVFDWLGAERNFDLTALGHGMYFVDILVGKEIFRTKIIHN